MNKNTIPTSAHHRHWHYVYKRRRKLKAISSREIIVGQIIAMFGSLIAGLLLELNKDSLALMAGTFLLLPGLIDLSATITGTMCARINHQLETNNKTFRVAEGGIVFALIMAIGAGSVVAICGGLIGEIFFDSSFWQLGVLTLGTLLIVGLIASPLMAFMTVLIRRRGADPDNIIGPVETGFTDMLTIIVVSLMIRLLV